MFSNRALKVSVVKTTPHTTASDEATAVASLDKVYSIAKAEATNVAIGVAALYAFKVAVDTTSQVLINRSKNR